MTWGRMYQGGEWHLQCRWMGSIPIASTMNVNMMVIEVAEAPKFSGSIRVFLNGEDVSNRTLAALIPRRNDREGDGWMRCLALSSEGGMVLDEENEELVTEKLYGKTRWEFKSHA